MHTHADENRFKLIYIVCTHTLLFRVNAAILLQVDISSRLTVWKLGIFLISHDQALLQAGWGFQIRLCVSIVHSEWSVRRECIPW